MTRILVALAVGVGVGAGGMTLANHDDKAKPNRKVVAERDIAEKLDGKEAKATVVELTLEPGQHGDPHRHPGPVFGYVLEGEYEHAINDDPAKTLKMGETFYEPTGVLHRVAKNPSTKTKTRILAVVLHSRDAKQIAIPEPKKY